MKNIILNDEYTSNSIDTSYIDVELKKAINNLKGSFFDIETGNVNYHDMKNSKEFELYKKTANKLNFFQLASLKSMEAKLAFWINIYNVLVIHGIIETGVKESVKEVSHFFERVSYKIDNYIFSLDDIEHGILRGNVKKHFFAKRPFANNDPRLSFVINKIEPRIHFSLVCGSKSCPPIGFYNEDKIYQQLDLATTSFINSFDVAINKDKKTITISKIFKWYGKDFGSRNNLIAFIAKYLKNEEYKQFLLANIDKIKIQYFDYNWNLNH